MRWCFCRTIKIWPENATGRIHFFYLGQCPKAHLMRDSLLSTFAGRFYSVDIHLTDWMIDSSITDFNNGKITLIVCLTQRYLSCRNDKQNNFRFCRFSTRFLGTKTYFTLWCSSTLWFGYRCKWNKCQQTFTSLCIQDLVHPCSEITAYMFTSFKMSCIPMIHSILNWMISVSKALPLTLLSHCIFKTIPFAITITNLYLVESFLITDLQEM